MHSVLLIAVPKVFTFHLPSLLQNLLSPDLSYSKKTPNFNSAVCCVLIKRNRTVCVSGRSAN